MKEEYQYETRTRTATASATVEPEQATGTNTVLIIILILMTGGAIIPAFIVLWLLGFLFRATAALFRWIARPPVTEVEPDPTSQQLARYSAVAALANNKKQPPPPGSTAAFAAGGPSRGLWLLLVLVIICTGLLIFAHVAPTYAVVISCIVSLVIWSKIR